MAGFHLLTQAANCVSSQDLGATELVQCRDVSTVVNSVWRNTVVRSVARNEIHLMSAVLHLSQLCRTVWCVYQQEFGRCAPLFCREAI